MYNHLFDYDKMRPIRQRTTPLSGHWVGRLRPQPFAVANPGNATDYTAGGWLTSSIISIQIAVNREFELVDGQSVFTPILPELYNLVPRTFRIDRRITEYRVKLSTNVATRTSCPETFHVRETGCS